MIAEPLEKGLAEDIENEKVLITWNKWVQTNWSPQNAGNKGVHLDIKEVLYIEERLDPCFFKQWVTNCSFVQGEPWPDKKYKEVPAAKSWMIEH